MKDRLKELLFILLLPGGIVFGLAIFIYRKLKEKNII